MPLPSSGSIGVSAINVELGRSSDSLFVFSSAAKGAYGTINLNNCSADRPDSSAPYILSEWYNYDHNRAALSASLSESTDYGSCSSVTSCTATTDGVTATPAGGCVGYSYSWEYVSGDLGPTPDSPTSATTTFSSDVPCGNVHVAVWRCVVTDGNGNTANSDSVTVTLENTETSCA